MNGSEFYDLYRWLGREYVAYDDKSLIAQYMKLSGYVFAEEEKLKEKLAKARAGMDACKAELMKRLIERKADNTKTDAGTAYLSHHMNVTVNNNKALLAYAEKNWDNGGGALIVIKPPVDAVRDYMGMNHDKPPPGCEIKTHTRINVRGS